MASWDAHWISLAYDPADDVGVFGFRRRVALAKVPDAMFARVSADQRYKLFVNGELVAWGPQRGDAQHWFYETVDLAPFLQEGDNRVSALVWNFGWMAPMAQHSVRTAFVLEAEGLSTPDGWEVAPFPNWGFAMMHGGLGEFYIDVGPGEWIHFQDAPWGWRTGEDDPSAEWRPPHVVARAEERGAMGGGTPWMLVPRSIPAMRYDVCDKSPQIRRGFAHDVHAPDPPEGPAVFPLELKPGHDVLLDWGELLCAFPRLTLEGPPGAELIVTYNEATWGPDGRKGHRDDVAGKSALPGYQDRFVTDGARRSIETLWWRTFRYVCLDASEPMTLHAFDPVQTGYPLAVESSFEADHADVAPIWDVSVRTAERCAGETYFDCPYYEQLQYVGDSRIQALIGYYLGRDRSLQRNAVETLGWSLMANGLTQSRYPSRQVQVIPPFSLWWVMMLYDQMLYDDPASRPDFASPQTLERVLGRFRKLQREEGQFWPFADWVPAWRGGVPPGGLNALVHQQTLDLATQAKNALKNVWNSKSPGDAGKRFWQDWPSTACHGEFATSSKSGVDCTPSEHAEALNRLLIGPRRDSVFGWDAWPTEALERIGAAKCTYYFSYYKHLAMRPIDYIAELAPWKQMIEDGLTTFAENPEPTRSDCHAWSAHPILGFFQIVAGVESVAPWWKAARIEPRPGSLRRFDARIAHPDGELRVAYEGGRLDIDSPVPFDLVWQGKTEARPSGSHRV